MSIYNLILGALLLCIGVICFFACETEDIEVPQPMIYYSPDSASVVDGPEVELIWCDCGVFEESWGHDLPVFSVYKGPNSSGMQLYGETYRYDTTMSITNLVPDQVVYWQIKANSHYGDRWEGPIWLFRVNRPIVYIAPEDGSIVPGPDFDLTWHALTGVTSEFTYSLYLGFTPEDLVFMESTTDTNLFVDYVIIDPLGTLYWRIEATDGDVINHGPLWHFFVGDETMVMPYNPYPPNDVSGVSVNVDLSWDYSGPPGDVIYCDVYMAPPYPLGVVSDNQTETTYDPGTLENNTEYFWKIVAFTSPTDSVIGPDWNFVTEDVGDMEIPTDPHPADGESDVDVTPYFSWSYTGTPEDVIYCDVYLGTTPDPELVSDNLDDTHYHEAGWLEFDMTYYWRIVAFNSSSDSTIGPLWSFTTEDSEIPRYPDPADGAISVGVTTNLSWEYSGNPEDVFYCDVYFGTTPNPPLVSDNLDATTYDPPGDLEFGTTYYWKIVAYTSGAYLFEGPVWSFTTQMIVTQDIYAQFKLTADILFPYFSWDVITARFDSSYAPNGPIHALQADSVTVNDSLMNWNSFSSDYSYQEDPSLHWLVNGGPYYFNVYGNAQLPDMTLGIDWLACSPMITYPTSADTIYNTGFTTTWDGTCAGNVILTFVINGTDTTDVWIETANDGEYTFTASDLDPLQGFTGVISEVIILRDSYFINEPGYQAQSEVIMRSTHTVSTIID